MWNCKVCAEKERRISDLKDQILYFKRLLNPVPTTATQTELEADYTLDGAGREEIQTPTIHEEYKEQALDVEREADLIFSGNTGG